MSEVPPKRSRWRRTAIEIAGVLLIVVAFRAWQTRDAPDGPAPELRGPALDGSMVALSEASGEPVLVHFWATWCGVCRAEQGTIDALARDHRVITVASQSGGLGELGSYMSENTLSFTVVPDPRGQLASRWGVRAYPTSFVVGPDGSVRSVEVGYTTSLGLRARLWLAGVW